MLAPFATPVLVLSLLGSAPCSDPLPLEPAVVTREMKLTGFSGSDQTGPVCYLRWEGGTSPGLMIYGPTPMAEFGRTFGSTKEAADQYAGESPPGWNRCPGSREGTWSSIRGSRTVGYSWSTQGRST